MNFYLAVIVTSFLQLCWCFDLGVFFNYLDQDQLHKNSFIEVHGDKFKHDFHEYNRPVRFISSPNASKITKFASYPVVRVINMKSDSILAYLKALRQVGQLREAFFYLILTSGSATIQNIQNDEVTKDIANLVYAYGHTRPKTVYKWQIFSSNPTLVTIEHYIPRLAPYLLKDNGQPVNFHGASLIVYKSPLRSPYFGTTDSGTAFGSENRLMEYLGRALHFRPIIKETTDGHFGVQLANGTWTGVIGALRRREGDFGVGWVTPTASRVKVVDFSRSYLISNYIIFSHKPLPVAKWKAIFWAFQGHVWIGIAASLTLFLTIAFSIVKARQYNEYTLIHLSLTTLQILVQQSLAHKLYSSKLRVLFASWLIASSILFFAYSGNLVSTFFTPPENKPIDTVADIAKSTYYHFVLESSSGTYVSDYFKNSKDPNYQKLYEKSLNAPERYKSFGVIRNIFNFIKLQDIASFTTKSFMQVLIAVNYSSPIGESPIHISREHLGFSSCAVVLQKGAPFKRDVDKIVQSGIEAGFYTHWLNKAVEQTKIIRRKNDVAIMRREEKAVERALEKLGKVNRSRKLSLEHLQGSFFLLFLGMSISALALLRETIKL